MGLFGKKATSLAQDLPSGQVVATPKDLGVVIHVMPKDFLGGEAKLREEQIPKIVPQAPVLPKPVPKPAIVPRAQTIPPKRSVPMWMWVLMGVLLLFVAASAAYVVILKSQTQVPEVDVPTSAVLPTETPIVDEMPVDVVPTEPELSKDSDSDGLSDIEERMYGTDYRNPDTDGDTFLDGNEVFHRYDPLGVAPSTLLDTGAVKVFSEGTLPFQIYYPISWKASTDLSNNLVTFKTPNVAFITVAWYEKDPDLTIEDWIVTNVEDIDLTTLKASYTKEGYYTLRSQDDLVAYIDFGTTVYVMTYDLSTTTDISYTQTFAMMVNSLTITP